MAKKKKKSKKKMVTLTKTERVNLQKEIKVY